MSEESGPLTLPASAVSAEMADVQATGTLIFKDAGGRIVWACRCGFKPFFFPHGAALDQAIAGLVSEVEQQLGPFPVAQQRSEVNCREEAPHGQSVDEEPGRQGSAPG